MYARVFITILDSSINLSSVPLSARWLWLTMLLIADDAGTGVVDVPVERLAAKAGLSVPETEEGLRILSAPDPDSRSEEEEGRRIVPLRDGRRGWILVNWEKYREITNREAEREATRNRVRRFRERQKMLEGPSSGNGSEIRGNVPASASASASSPASVGRAVEKSTPSVEKSQVPKDGIGDATTTTEGEEPEPAGRIPLTEGPEEPC